MDGSGNDRSEELQLPEDLAQDRLEEWSSRIHVVDPKHNWDKALMMMMLILFV